MKLKNSWFTDLKNKRRDRENQDCTIFCPHVSLCVFSPYIFFVFFFLYFYVILVFCFFGCFRQFCFCRNTLQNSYSEEKKYCDSRASNLIIQRLSLCLHDKRNRHTNKSHNYHLEKKREREKEMTKGKKNREAALLAKTWRVLNRSKRIRSTGRVLLVRSVIPLVPPSDAGFCNRRVN